MKLSMIFLLCAMTITLSAQNAQDYSSPKAKLGPFSTAVNFALDLTGTTDTTPTAWGSSGWFASKIQFHPPAGYRTRILHVYGDFIAYPKYPGIVPAGTSCEIGWGLKTTAPDGGALVTFPGYSATPFDNSMIWLQDFIDWKTPRTRLPFSEIVDVGGLLETDNVLLSQAFVALNTTGLAVHLEPTFVIVFQYERE